MDRRRVRHGACDTAGPAKAEISPTQAPAAMLSAMKRQRSKQRALPRSGDAQSPFTMATSDDIRRALERVDLDVGWDQLAPNILPLLSRRVPSPIRAGAPVQAMLGPGIIVGFGIDFGPAFATVTRDLAERWGVADGDIAAMALANVRGLALELPPGAVKRVDLDEGVVVRILQSGAGWASGLLIVPDLLPRFFGPGPHLVGALCRDVVMAFAEDTSLDLVFDLVESLGWADPVGLIPTCYRHVGGVLQPITAPPRTVVLPEVDPPVRQRFVS